MGLLQRVFDEQGIPTISITLVPEITNLAQPSLACFVAHPFGLTLGSPGDAPTHRAVLEACLREATIEHAPGTVVDLGFRWPTDLRERQLRKQAL